MLVGWDEEEGFEVRQRCSVIVENAERFDQAQVDFCQAVFAWAAQQDYRR